MSRSDSSILPDEAQPVTLEAAIHWGAGVLAGAELHYGHGTDNPVDESLLLACHVVELEPWLDEAQLQMELTLAQQRAFQALLERRIRERVPAAYLIHEAWFCGLPFYVDERVLVPRSPIAELIEAQFSPWVDARRVDRILDLCTGSGCIAIACAAAFPGAKVDASDLSPDALEVAAINVERHEMGERVKLLQSDLFDELPPQQYDIIVSNPPYVPGAVVATLPPEYKHEPGMGLLSGESGLEVVQRILQEAPAYLAEDGILVVEVGLGQEALEQRFPDVPFTWLEFERGGEGVFLLEAGILRRFAGAFAGGE